jgi:hypothetical protein
VLATLVLGGCAMGPVAKGTLIGAAAGAALGAGTGALVTDPDYLGSPEDDASGNIALKAGPTIAASSLIGVVFGALVGAMIGHGQDDGDSEEPPPAEAQARRTQPAAF